ncbi:MAG: methionyl-tRNA formyltransferase [Patescibacteria group bacterium]
MDVRVIYDPILRQVAQPVTVFDAELKKEADAMLKTMKSHIGIGLAANQVGLDKQLIVLGYQPTGPDDELPALPFLQLVNPRVIKTSQEKEVMTEGCLSLPGLELPVERSVGVTIEANDLTGKKTVIKAKGLLARVLQHEIDHINGNLFTDHVKNYQNLADYRFARIVFIGSDDFSLVQLKALHDAGLNVIAAVTETDKPAGRGQQLKEPVIKTAAKEIGIAVFQPEDKEEIASIITQLEADLVVLASYGKILPEEALTAPAFGAINIHPSLLPKFRGATPIQSAILEGAAETGVTIMEMTAKVDAGRMISQQKTEILDSETAGQLRKRLAKLGAKMLLEAIPSYLSGQAKLTVQNQADVTLTKRFAKEDGQINWDEPAKAIVNQVRALQPWPGTFTFLGGLRLKIIEAALKEGKVLPITVQIEGKTPTPWNDFGKGYKDQLTKEAWYGKITW